MKLRIGLFLLIKMSAHSLPGPGPAAGSCPRLLVEGNGYIREAVIAGECECFGQSFPRDYFLDSMDFQRGFHLANSVAKAGFSVERSMFRGYSSFQGMRIGKSLGMMATEFLDTADFNNMYIGHRADFERCDFRKSADFSFLEVAAKFRMHSCRFLKEAPFEVSAFQDSVVFIGSRFSSSASFRGSHFRGRTFFRACSIGGVLNFSHSRFDRSVFFTESVFRSSLLFNTARIDSILEFKGCRPFGRISFVDAEFGPHAAVRFRQVDISDTITVGNFNSDHLQKFDLAQASFLPGARVMLSGPADLRIQRGKLEFVMLKPDLDYYSKQAIIYVLKKHSFDADDVRAQFDLDYMLARSVRGQAKSDRFLLDIWPARLRDCLYEKALGLGYRPLRFLVFIAAFILLSAWACGALFPEFLVSHYDLKGISLSFSKRMLYAVYFCGSLFFLLKFPRSLMVKLKPPALAGASFMIWLSGISSYIILLTCTEFGYLFPALENLLKP